MIHVEDNFFKDPYQVRSSILKQKYTTGTFLWPGVRSCTPEKISNYILDAARQLMQEPNLKLDESTCQVIGTEYKEGGFHHDGEYADFTSINFLSLEPPSNSGTEICDTTGNPDVTGVVPMEMWGEHLRIKENFYKNPKHFLNSYKYVRMRKRINSKFNPVAKIPHKFNRWLIFDSNRHHRAQKFFGTSASNARLTIVSFFKK